MKSKKISFTRLIKFMLKIYHLIGKIYKVSGLILGIITN